MNNTLNPCKCDSGTGTGGDASDVIYDGLSVDCLPGLVGQNLATAIKRLGDAMCDAESETISVTVNSGPPTGGELGDIWFRQQGNVVTVYQYDGGSVGWVAKGDLVMGGTALTFENGLREDNGVVKLGLDATTVGTTNKGLLVENTFLVLGDLLTQEASTLEISEDLGGMVRSITLNSFKGSEYGRVRTDVVAYSGEEIPRVLFERKIGFQVQNLQFDGNTLMSINDGINQKGLEEAADYSANKTQYSYVTLKMLNEVAGGLPTYTSDPSTPNTSALSYLNSTYPNAKPGDQVYKTAGGSRRTWTCYATGEWSRIDEVIEI